MKHLTLAIGCALLMLSACAVQKDLIPTGGSKADGIVKLSFETKLFENVTVNEEQGLQTAIRRCQAWGYRAAERFGGFERKCFDADCYQYSTTFKYQCLD